MRFKQLAEKRAKDINDAAKIANQACRTLAYLCAVSVVLTASGFGSGHFFLNLFVFVDCVFIFASVKHHIMSLDIIYLIIGTPITIAVMYGSHCIKRSRKRRIETPEAKPYEFERDEYRPEFDEFSKMLYQRRMYRGGQEL